MFVIWFYFSIFGDDLSTSYDAWNEDCATSGCQSSYQNSVQTDALVGAEKFNLLYFLGNFYGSCLIQRVYKLIYWWSLLLDVCIWDLIWSFGFETRFLLVC